MRLLMDADCLIKLTKAGLKERVCNAWPVSIPDAVRRETTENAPELPDAMRIRDNIDAGRIAVVEASMGTGKGEEEALRLFRASGTDAIATDDGRFIRTLRGLGVAYAVPAVIVVKLLEEGVFSAGEAVQALASLRPYISPEEHATAQLMLSDRRMP
jgi:hypothetical protein